MIKLSDEIAELLATTVGSGFYQELMYLWPLTAVHLDAGHMAEAVAAAGQLLRDARSGLSGDLKSAVEAASRAWDQGQSELCRDKLAAALALARELTYC